MIDALIAGKLFGAAVERTGQSGKAFVTAKVRATDSDGEGQFINVVAFDDRAKTALLALSDGDSVSVSGAMKIGTYEARDGTTRISISMVAAAVLTSYHVRRKREAVAQASGPKPEPPERATATRKHQGLRDAEKLYGGDAAPMVEDRLDEPF
ncbi:UNVERIFIED_ORG: single-stranded DNA-binding protein [Burkholderia sp. 1595]|uniref:Single-stranded DNA-binding protein n=1 Tax=Paraburkholderia terricola TaxID=169427 RepID=A0ABU1LT88_9BURK|nr:single-stranded DNA-binding protein [Paraburkholderia terricola]MDR6409740.1 single-stranded DNA-binding protein [Paraburkholderia terricola]